MDIQESNKLIAEFMELPTTPLGLYVYSSNHLRNKYGLEYHKSWSWLMPVVEKINGGNVLGDPEIRMGRRVELFYHDPREGVDIGFKPTGATIEKVYKSVVDFIQWYNQNK